MDPDVESNAITALDKWRSERDNAAVDEAIDQLARVAATDENLMPATINLARAGGTTGEWAQVLRDTFGEYRAPTGVAAAVGVRPRHAGEGLSDIAARLRAAPGGPPRLLIGKPGTGRPLQRR